MDMRAAKLALARKKLRDHQEKKISTTPKFENLDPINISSSYNNNCGSENGNNIQVECNETIDHGTEITTKNQVLIEPTSVDINVTELLISNKRNLEDQVTDLQMKINQLELDYKAEINNHNSTRQQVSFLQNELKDLMDKNAFVTENRLSLENRVQELDNLQMKLSEDNSNLSEQLELTKSILSAKETENTYLNNQLHLLQSELDFMKLQLQQLTSGSNVTIAHSDTKSEQSEELIQKISNLEELLKTSQKEKDQINNNYEQYVRELNEQLKAAVLKNEELIKVIQNLSHRESLLIEQVSDMEKRLQSSQGNVESMEATAVNNEELQELQDKYKKLQNDLEDIQRKYEELSSLYIQSQNRVQELQEEVNSNTPPDNISISKLTADIASDKIAAQRATEQNKKLKTSIQELEESFIKMSQDKLELTEKLSAEKYLNRELTIKLAEIDEKCKDLHIKLRAKDEEMIRLQMSYRELERDFENRYSGEKISDTLTQDSLQQKEESSNLEETHSLIEVDDNSNEKECLKDCRNPSVKDNIPREDAMLKLQERFLKIMGEVADLSDEKHRLEHIILQLQNETDTICEYVALYQQQRSLLKKRDEERNAQIKLFQVECDRLKSQLEELSRTILKFAEDKELSSYFLVEHRKNDMEKIRSLLVNLKNSSFVDPKISLELSNVYPCNCCSGNLIDV